MAVPKRKTSKSTKGQRNSHAALRVATTTACRRCGYQRPPHRVCPQCGHYKDREVVAKEE
jgi:large subunit ribosomal protein L32